MPERELSPNQSYSRALTNKELHAQKMHMHENIKAITANIRGINASGKRQILSAKWEKEGVDIALLSEVQKNTGGMEKEGHWGKYTVFFSTGINPKKREELEQSRERKACEAKKKNRKQKGKVDQTKTEQGTT